MSLSKIRRENQSVDDICYEQREISGGASAILRSIVLQWWYVSYFRHVPRREFITRAACNVELLAGPDGTLRCTKIVLRFEKRAVSRSSDTLHQTTLLHCSCWNKYYVIHVCILYNATFNELNRIFIYPAYTRVVEICLCIVIIALV